jgi:NAD(P)H-dependent FMN reductase
MKTKIHIILGSTRQNRFGEKPAKWILDKISQIPNVDAELIDLRDYPLPFFDEAVSPASNKGEYSLDLAKQWANKVGEADGYIIVTPEYNHGYPAVLKNALDYVYAEWNKKPVGFVSYGTVGGARVVEQLREVVIELQMVPVRSAVHITNFWSLLDEQGNLDTSAFEKNADGMIDQVLWFASVLKSARQ